MKKNRSMQNIYHMKKSKKSLVEGGRSLGDKESTVLLVDVGKTVRQGESELGGQELLDVLTTNISILNFSDTDDLNRSETSTVTSSHVLVTGLDSLNTTHGTVFLVHVVGTGTRIVTDPDTKVLDLLRTLLGNLSSNTNQHLSFYPYHHQTHTTLTETISPAAFLTLRSFFKKYQKRDFATTTLGAKIRIRKSLGATS